MITIKTKQLLDGVTGVAQFASERKENRPNLQGVAFNVAGDRIELAATDTYAMGICDLGAYHAEHIYYVFLNDTKVKELTKVLKDTKLSDVNLYVYDTGVVRVTTPSDGTILFSADSDVRQFPKYREVLPTYLDDRSGLTNFSIVPSRLAKLAKVPSADRHCSIFKAQLGENLAMEFTRVDDYGKGNVSSWRIYVMPIFGRK